MSGRIGMKPLRYGENPRQGSELIIYAEAAKSDPLAISRFRHLRGSDMSYVNVTDIDRALETLVRIDAGTKVNEFKTSNIAVAVKHGNACGASSSVNPAMAVRDMIDGDRQAIFGGTVLLNFVVSVHIAQLLRTYGIDDGDPPRKLGTIVAESFDADAISILMESEKARCDRLLENPELGVVRESKEPCLSRATQHRMVRGGDLRQDADSYVLKIPWTWDLTPIERQDVMLGWAIGSTSNSNSIILVRKGRLIGSGLAQTSRVAACRVAVMNASASGHSINGAVAYSDSFFPFEDGPLVLADAGVKTIFATSGSVRDEKVAKVCAEHNVKLLTLPDKEARGFRWH